MNFWRKRPSERVLFEDALKYIYNCNYNKSTASLESLEGALTLSGKKALRLIERLENQKLLYISGNGLHLTPAG